jgi:galactose mutarotase-like enzyme
VTLQSLELTAVVLPELGGRIYSLVHRDTGTELLRVIDPIRFVNFGPYDAGYEFSLDYRWHGRGTRGAYEVRQRSATEVQMQMRMPKGLLIASRYGLRDDTLELEHTVTNGGDEEAALTPMTHPEWSVALFGDTGELRLAKPGGAFMEMAVNPEGRRDRVLSFEGEQKPDGRWTLTDANRTVTLEETFEQADVASCVFKFAQRRGNLNLELRFPPQTLQPKQSATYRTTWRVSGSKA